MIVTTLFPILNTVNVADTPWAVSQGDRTLVTRSDGRRLMSVGLSRRGRPVPAAPRVLRTTQGSVATEILLAGQDQLDAEYDLRAWQSLLLPYIFIDIDFDKPQVEYKAESPEEDAETVVKSFASSRSQKNYNVAEFSVLGRAFLKIEEGRSSVEAMSFFRDGRRAQDSGRSIDAINSYYLYIESRFLRGRTGEQQAAATLAGTPAFMVALREAVEATI